MSKPKTRFGIFFNRAGAEQIVKWAKEMAKEYTQLPVCISRLVGKAQDFIDSPNTAMEKSKNLCSGCRESWYNFNKPNGCWSYKSAIVVKKMVHPSIRSTDKDRIEIWCLSCYSYDYKASFPYGNRTKH